MVPQGFGLGFDKASLVTAWPLKEAWSHPHWSLSRTGGDGQVEVRARAKTVEGVTTVWLSEQVPEEAYARLNADYRRFGGGYPWDFRVRFAEVTERHRLAEAPRREGNPWTPLCTASWFCRVGAARGQL